MLRSADAGVESGPRDSAETDCYEWMLVLERLFDHTTSVLLYIARAPVSINNNFYIAYILSFIGLAYFSYSKYYKTERSAFFKFLFPKEIYTHKSAIVDYYIYFINLFISPVLAFVEVGVQTYIATSLGRFLIGLNAGRPIIEGDWSTTTYLSFIVGFTMVSDFSVYLIHRFHHQSKVFWPIHALHHSAEVMTPFTLFRKHPLWNSLAGLVSKIFTGIFQGIFLFVFYGNPSFEILFGLNTIHVIYNFFGSNLRHSHVWLSWGKPLSYVFISPAMHQVHHDPIRMTKNYGEIFAIWDWLWGSLYIPEQKEEFAIGIGVDQENPHSTVAKAYYVPVVEFLREIKKKFEWASN